jgi:DNA-binding transcriptional LysR family regulator
MTPLWQIRNLLSERRVELVLEDDERPTMPIAVVSRATQRLPAETRWFADLLAARLKRDPVMLGSRP